MRYLSTRGSSPDVELADAVRNGAAPDGGLYLPQEIPTVGDLGDTDDAPAFAARMLQPFFTGSSLDAELGDACRTAFAQPLPIVPVDDKRPNLLSLELFHGPTGAFK